MCDENTNRPPLSDAMFIGRSGTLIRHVERAENELTRGRCALCADETKIVYPIAYKFIDAENYFVRCMMMVCIPCLANMIGNSAIEEKYKAPD